MEKLTPSNQIKLQNIIQYYNEYRKTYYDESIYIEIENKKREEQQYEIDKQLQKLENIKKTEEYLLLNNEKNNIIKQILDYENIVYDVRNTYEEYKHYEDVLDDTEEVKIICEKITLLDNTIETIENKQLDIIKKNDIDIELFKNKMKL
jgi:hypothetical protein